MLNQRIRAKKVEGRFYRSSLLLDAIQRLLRDKLAIMGLVIMALFLLTALFAPLLAPYDPIDQTLRDRRQRPSGKHLLGTDDLGRDILSRIIFGTRKSLQVGVLSVGLAILVGALFGALSGYLGGWFDTLLMRLMDILMAFPSLLLAIAIVTILGPGLLNMLYAIGIVSIPVYARVVRASVLSVKAEDYILAARALGTRHRRILFRHVLPNCLTPLIVQGTLGIGTAILDAAGL
ncbi:MAG: ABC transporter permease, partial [Chloroflexota bacterium]|nr:ABC transporter permease [Chloroflexota bacterium]